MNKEYAKKNLLKSQGKVVHIITLYYAIEILLSFFAQLNILLGDKKKYIIRQNAVKGVEENPN